MLPGTEQLDIALPPHGTLFQVYGNITYEPGWPRSQVSMRFYDEQHRVVLAHTNSPFSAGYQLKMPRGEYQVRVALIAPTGGILKEYDMGKVRIEGEKRWDIDLDRAPTVVLDRPQADTNPYALDQNFPNPFNPATLISYRIPSEAYVKLTVYDVLGRKVRQLINERPQGGTYQVRWDGRDGTGREVSSGVYLYRLVAKTENGVWTQSRKLVLVR